MAAKKHPRNFIAGAFPEGTRCAYCLRHDVPMARDHIVPVTKGGSDSYDNIVPACTSCNSAKAERSLLGFLQWQVAGATAVVPRPRQSSTPVEPPTSVESPKRTVSRALIVAELERIRMDAARAITDSVTVQQRCMRLLGASGAIWHELTGEKAPGLEISARVVQGSR